MIINSANIASLFQGYNASFNKGVLSAPSLYKDIAMVIPSSSSQNTYAWLGQFPKLREWVGDRVVKNLESYSYSIVNKLFESTIKVARTEIEDDQYGIYSPLISEIGRASAEHPDELIFSLLKNALHEPCYDGQFFFDTDHPVGTGENVVSVSNVNLGGPGPYWYLLDTSRAIKPFIFQDRTPYSFQQLTNESDENVFMRDEYLFGVRARANAGLGLWQLAFASALALNSTNYAAARSAMMSYKRDEGRPLGIVPNKLVVGPSLEGAARQLVNNPLVANAGVPVSNEWAGSVELVVVPWLA